jgi:hypothetical protein
MATALFITKEDLTKSTSLNGNVDVDKFVQYIKIAQDIHIQNYLGTDLYNKISADIVASTLAVPYSTLVNTYIKPMLIHWAMVEYLPWAAYTIANKGVYKHGSENSESVSKEEVDFLVEKERSIAENYTKRFVDYMCFNNNLYPEYNTNSNDDINPDRDINLSGWYL